MAGEKGEATQRLIRSILRLGLQRRTVKGVIEGSELADEHGVRRLSAAQKTAAKKALTRHLWPERYSFADLCVRLLSNVRQIGCKEHYMVEITFDLECVRERFDRDGWRTKLVDELEQAVVDWTLRRFDEDKKVPVVLRQLLVMQNECDMLLVFDARNFMTATEMVREALELHPCISRVNLNMVEAIRG